MALDPVCGREVEELSAAAKSEYGGQTCLFCSIGCKKHIEREPLRFMGLAEAVASPASAPSSRPTGPSNAMALGIPVGAGHAAPEGG